MKARVLKMLHAHCTEIRVMMPHFIFIYFPWLWGVAFVLIIFNVFSVLFFFFFINGMCESTDAYVKALDNLVYFFFLSDAAFAKFTYK